MPTIVKGKKKPSNVEIDYDSFNRWAIAQTYNGEPIMKLVGTQYYQNYSCSLSRDEIYDRYRAHMKRESANT